MNDSFMVDALPISSTMNDVGHVEVHFHARSYAHTPYVPTSKTTTDAEQPTTTRTIDIKLVAPIQCYQRVASQCLVALRPILEVCDRETGYKVGRHREISWRQTAARNQLSATLKYISSAAMERGWKYGRRGKNGGGDRDIEESEVWLGRNGYWYAGRETGEAQVGK